MSSPILRLLILGIAAPSLSVGCLFHLLLVELHLPIDHLACLIAHTHFVEDEEEGVENYLFYALF
jgi:hypothetical protein